MGTLFQVLRALKVCLKVQVRARFRSGVRGQGLVMVGEELGEGLFAREMHQTLCVGV